MKFWIKYGIVDKIDSGWREVESTDLLSAYDLAQEKANVLYDILVAKGEILDLVDFTNEELNIPLDQIEYQYSLYKTSFLEFDATDTDPNIKK